MKIGKEGRLGYLAGLLDAEGSITFNNPYSKKHPYPRITPMIVVGQSKGKIVMSLFKKEFGGSIHKGKLLYKGEERIIYQYAATGVAAQRIILRLLTHLKIKREHANLLLEIWKAKEKEDYIKELKLAKELSTLNLKSGNGPNLKT